MKAILSLPIILALSSVAEAEVKDLKPEEAKPRPSHTALTQKQAVEKRNNKRSKGVVPVKPGTLPQPVPTPAKGIVERSSVLCMGGNWTIVPKGSVVYVPPGYASRVDGARKGNLVPWKEFHERNRSWLHAHSVSVPQARGEAVSMTPEEAEAYKQIGRVVVAVCHDGPISVLPYEAKEEAASGAGQKPGSGKPGKP
jgi:hypothetical protein